MDPRVEATLNAAADALDVAVQLVAELSFSDRAVVVRLRAPADRAPARARQVLTHQLEWLESNENLMPATAAFAHDLARVVGEHFPSQPLPLYRAFRTAEARP